MEEELDNLIQMLEKDLDWLREHPHPENSTAHKYTRMFLTLARAIRDKS